MQEERRAGISGKGLRTDPTPSTPSMRHINQSDLAEGLLTLTPSHPRRECQQAWPY